LDTGEKQMHSILESLMRLLNLGPSVIAGEIIEELSTEITDKIVLGKNASEGPPTFASSTLSKLYEELGEIKTFMDYALLPMTVEEKRRISIAYSKFDQAIRNNMLTLPALVLDKMNICKDQVVDTDGRADEIHHVYKVFLDRTPKFTGVMNASVEDFTRSMLEGISMGQGLQEDLSKHDGKEALTGHLEELIEAASMLLEKIDSRRNLYGVERENADSKHEELIMQIEEEIKRLNEVENSFNVQAILEPLLAAIKDLDLDFGHERHRRIDTQDSEDEVHDVNEVDETRPTTADDQSRPASAITDDLSNADSNVDGAMISIEAKEELSEGEKERLAEVEKDLEKYRLAEAEAKREAEEEAQAKVQALEIALSDMDALLSDQDGQVDEDLGKEEIEKLEHEQELRILESIIKQEEKQQEEALQRLGMYFCKCIDIYVHMYKCISIQTVCMYISIYHHIYTYGYLL
jgi:hypothetical protein